MGACAKSWRATDDWPQVQGPGTGHVQIRTLASAFNHMDLWVTMGIPGLDLAYPRISGCDACGVAADTRG